MTVRIAALPGETQPIPGAGLGALTTDSGNLPLDTVEVRAAVTGLVAGIEVSQGFRNPFDIPLEATYVFPLPDRAAVTGLRMEAADRVVEGTLKERGEARSDYEAALAAGQRAAIAEEERPDVFTMRVGNILPGERVTVTLTLDQPLPYEDDSATFRFPLVVASRYIPGTPLPDTPAGDGVASDTDAVPDASRISPPVLLPGFPNPVRLSLTVDIDPAGLPLTDVRSSLHVIAQEHSDGAGDGPGRMTVRLHPGERLDRDFILRLGYREHQTAAASLTLTADRTGSSGTSGIEEGAEEGTFTVTVLPPAGSGQARPRDVVLLLDRSASMSGWKMVAARRAAARIVDTLTDGDRFAVLAFDHSIERPDGLDSGLSTASDRNRFRAVEYLAGLETDGGTEMLAPLQEGTRLLGGGEAGRDRVLVLITDGQVGDEDRILSHLVPALAGVRVHTVGIDQAINAGFLRRLATVGQGRFELVESEDRLDEAMEHIHHRISAPLLTGLSLDWSGVTVVPDTTTPPRPGALFPGVPAVISGRYRGRPGEDCSVTVRGTTADGQEWSRQAAASTGEDGAARAVWARAHLRDLEDRYAATWSEESEELEDRIMDTSLRFGVLCRFTAFVAVDSRVATEGEPVHQVVQPVEQPAGWEMIPPYGAMPTPAMRAPIPPAALAPMGPPPPCYPSDDLPPTPPIARCSTPAYGYPLTSERSFDDYLTLPEWDTPSTAAEDSPRITESAAREQVEEELDLLTTLADAPWEERWQHLSGLRTRLTELTRQLRDAGLPTGPLVALAGTLAVTDDPGQQSRLDELWSLTVRKLTAYATSAQADGKAPSRAQAPRRPFWKHRP